MRDSRKIGWGELVVPLLAVFYMVYTVGYQITNNFKSSTINYSLFLSIPIIFSVCAIVVKVLSTESEDEKTTHGDYKRIIYFLFMTIALIALINFLGYILSFFAYLISCFWLMGIRSLPKILAISTGVVVFVYLVFGIWLGLPLPVGIFRGLF